MQFLKIRLDLFWFPGGKDSCQVSFSIFCSFFDVFDIINSNRVTLEAGELKFGFFDCCPSTSSDVS
jgi:hypothetical protein